MRPGKLSRFMVAAALVVAVLGCGPQAPEPRIPEPPHDDALPDPTPIPPLEPGTRINPKSLPERTHLVFRSQPKLTSGDAKKIMKSIRSALEEFTTLVVVEAEPDPAQPGKFRRGAYRIGIGKPAAEGDVVVTRDTASKVGVSLSVFERKLLSEREKELATVRSPGSSPTMVLFEFSMFFRRDGKPTPIVVRYMSLVDPASGDFDTVYWVLDATEAGYRFHGDSVFLLPPNHEMDWEMHVDGEKISLLGAPQPDAFTSTKLPQSEPLPASNELAAAAAARAFTPSGAAALEAQVRKILAAR
ncbi:MAG: hypothetical protein JNL96_05105 [Planctomycetaceae bacterium]|nr:hypothetical protein [Planctomycetaceae bacterium]